MLTMRQTLFNDVILTHAEDVAVTLKDYYVNNPGGGFISCIINVYDMCL